MPSTNIFLIVKNIKVKENEYLIKNANAVTTITKITSQWHTHLYTLNSYKQIPFASLILKLLFMTKFRADK